MKQDFLEFLTSAARTHLIFLALAALTAWVKLYNSELGYWLLFILFFVINTVQVLLFSALLKIGERDEFDT